MPLHGVMFMHDRDLIFSVVFFIGAVRIHSLASIGTGLVKNDELERISKGTVEK
jgi:hypothetical protein